MINYPNRSITVVNVIELQDLRNSIDQKNTFFIEIDGNIVRDIDILHEKFSKIIGFPEWFGKNWDAFWDIMTDEDFLNKNLIIVIKNYSKLLVGSVESNSDMKIFSRILLDLIQTDLIDTKIQIFFIKD